MKTRIRGRASSLKPLVTVGIGIALLGAFGGGGIYASYRAVEVSHWPATQAQITASRVSRWGTRSGERRRHYSAVLDYSYVVEGRTYRGNASEGGTDRVSAQRRLEEHPVGSSLTVYYNPEDPADRELERLDDAHGRYVGPAAGLLALAICLWIARKQRRASSPSSAPS